MSYVIAGYTLVLGALGLYGARLAIRTRQVAALMLELDLDVAAEPAAPPPESSNWTP